MFSFSVDLSSASRLARVKAIGGIMLALAVLGGLRYAYMDAREGMPQLELAVLATKHRTEEIRGALGEIASDRETAGLVRDSLLRELRSVSYTLDSAAVMTAQIDSKVKVFGLSLVIGALLLFAARSFAFEGFAQWQAEEEAERAALPQQKSKRR